MTSWKAGATVFGTSAAVLVLEVIAGRLMAPYVGISLETFTGIIGTMLAGIAVGSAAGGWLADRVAPDRLIAPSLVLGGALTWLSLPVVGAVGPPVAGTGPVGVIVLTTAAFFLPAVVLSAVSPMVAKLRLSRLEETGSVVGGLSAAGTVGALAGTFLTGFVLVAALPSRTVVLLVGGLLVLAGAVVRWRLRRGRPSVAAVAVVVATGLVGASSSSPCELETAYFCVQVEEDPDRASGRTLYLDRLRHAYVDLEDPTHLELRYVRLLGAVADALPAGPIDALHVGGGGFTLPRYVEAVRPGSANLVLEIDGELVDVARDRLGLRTGEGLEVEVGDARLALGGQPSGRFDLVVGDAFASPAVPWHLTTLEVVTEIARALRPGGVYAMNVIDGGDSAFARAQLATLAERFAHLAVILPAGGVPSSRGANQVLLASHRPLPALALDAGDGRVLDGEALRRFVGDARVLTDDHAPVDQLVVH